jgi:hypothetical protein
MVNRYVDNDDQKKMINNGAYLRNSICLQVPIMINCVFEYHHYISQLFTFDVFCNRLLSYFKYLLIIVIKYLCRHSLTPFAAFPPVQRDN